MPKGTKALDAEFERGVNMKPGKGWRLVSPTGRSFKASLAKRIKIGEENVALFRVSVPKPT
jgi:hypothetical protein